VIERALVLSDSDEIGIEDLPFTSEERACREDVAQVLLRSAAERRLTLRELEDHYIDQILQLTGGNKVQAAKVLGIDRKTLYRRAERNAEELRRAESG
jgi:DNA-binding NtrC family response regulator